jgi:hypothetical protein
VIFWLVFKNYFPAINPILIDVKPINVDPQISKGLNPPTQFVWGWGWVLNCCASFTDHPP